mmetsp:Transcript_5044/g.13694  ORF Transcript_5044/g.13694 Transcript_5044/m.13694 type:complete len:226 (+) Transcript_5044:233-910(+)|eukprot:CAMPEP_0202355106 /NCGR_PEP_ID=MMETSP1126-20121109/10137_1 /ASSEMBLY_ACC=CAM_ASM_000457 /TAXON_ID=3047 /ORGANISM="Dunaliella tertiolecta, Strain CCMP1320" /LENGTH=225 /DNA_ID=CAMNT_0048947663 /DNA_START=126 /DNA_END=803 /DNA_ORIENTATION=+
MSHANDPFYIIRGEVTESLHEVQQKTSRFYGLTATNPERKELAKSVQGECASIHWQLNELESAVSLAAADPERFNLTTEELGSRRRWIESVRRQIDGIQERLKAALANPVPSPQQSQQAAANQHFLGSESENQELLMRRQDESLDDIELHVNRIGRMGRAIGEELEGQGGLLDELDQDMDTTQSRLKATQKKMQDVIRKSGGNKQFCLLIFLIVVLAVLLVLAFN